MFTGIVETMGRVVRLTPNDFGVRLIIDPGGWGRARSIRPGDSVCVSGCCLTHAPKDGDVEGHLAFDVIRETLDKTTLGSRRAGDLVNLEASLTPSTPMGGHFVQGHIDGTGRIVVVHAGVDEWRVRVELPPESFKYVIPKGSVAIDGVSLTVASVDQASRSFELALIPTTLRLTTLGNAKAGDVVNIEADVITKAVVHTLTAQAAAKESVTIETLRRAGFVD